MKAQEYWNLTIQVKESINRLPHWKDDFNSQDRKNADRLSKFLFETELEQIKNCGCVDDFLYTLKNITFDKVTKKLEKMDKLFKIKEGIVITLHTFTDGYTNDNITDEKAIEILTKYPAMIVHFEQFPSDWMVLCGKQVMPIIVPGKNTNERELKLKEYDKDGLRKITNKLAEEKGIKKPHQSNGVKGLIKFILDNE